MGRKKYDCGICGKSFHRAKTRDKHEVNCGVKQLDEFGGANA